MRSALGILVLLSLIRPAPGQAEVHLASGVVLKGSVIEDDGSTIKVRLATDGQGSAIATYKYEQLQPQTIYRLQFNRTERDDIGGQIKLASYAADNGLFPSARLSWLLAKNANEAKKAGQDAEIATLYDRAPPLVLVWARKEIDAKRYVEAEKYLHRLCALFPDRDETVEAAKLLEEIATKSQGSRLESIEKKAAATSKTAQEAAAAAKKPYDRAHEMIRKAMGSTRNHSQAAREIEQAIEEFKKAQRLLDAAMKKEGAESDLAAHYEAWSAKLREDIIDAHLHIASIYTSRGSYKQALDEANAALALDPQHSEALGTRAHIELAMAAASNGWRW